MALVGLATNETGPPEVEVRTMLRQLGLMRFNDNLLSSSHDIQMAYEPDSPLASSYWIPAKTKLRRVDTDSEIVITTLREVT